MTMVGGFSCHTRRQKSTRVLGRGPEGEGGEGGREGGREGREGREGRGGREGVGVRGREGDSTHTHEE